MPRLEGKVDHVIGVDTHCDSHTAAILDRNGGLVAELTVELPRSGGRVRAEFKSMRAGGPFS